MTVFWWHRVVFTSTWHLYFRVTFSPTAAPEIHRFISKVRRMKQIIWTTECREEGGATITMGCFRLEKLLTEGLVGFHLALLVRCSRDQSGRWMSMLVPGDLEVPGLLTRGPGQITTDTEAMTTIQTSGSFWNVKTRSCRPTTSYWSQSWTPNTLLTWRWCTRSAQSSGTSGGSSASRGTPWFRYC